MKVMRTDCADGVAALPAADPLRVLAGPSAPLAPAPFRRAIAFASSLVTGAGRSAGASFIFDLQELRMALKPAGRKPGDTLRGPAKILAYEPRYREAVVEFMGKGYSLTAFAGEIGTTRANLMKWCAKHPPFAEAVERAQARRTRLLEDKMLAAKGAGAFGAHMQALKTAAPDEWSGSRPKAMTKSQIETAIALPNNNRD